MSFCNLNPRNYSLFACCHRVYKNAISTCRLIRLSTSHNYVCCVVVVVSMPLLGWQAILAGIMFSTCPFHPLFVRPSVRSFVCYQTRTRYMHFNVSWFKRFMGEGHKTVNFESQEVKGGQGHVRLLARYLTNCLTNYNQTWQADRAINAHYVATTGMQIAKGQRWRSHEAEGTFGDLVEASFSTHLGRPTWVE